MYQKAGCIICLILGLIVVIGFICFQIVMNSIVYLILTWPIWLGEVFEKYLEFLQRSYFNKLIGLFSIVMLAFVLHKLKKEALLIFGVIEFVGGVFIIWGSFNVPSDNNLTNAIALGAGIFLIVQGIENYSIGSAKGNDKANQVEIKE